MGKGIEFKESEDQLLIENAEHKTAKQLYELHQTKRAEFLWPSRTLKSIARRVERLRLEGKIGIRDQITRRKAYYERRQITKDNK